MNLISPEGHVYSLCIRIILLPIIDKPLITGWCRIERSRRVIAERYFLDANARLDHAREYGPKNQGDDGCCNYPTVSASTTTFLW